MVVDTFVELEQEDRYQLSRSHQESRVVNRMVPINLKLGLPDTERGKREKNTEFITCWKLV